jgi:pimeloyl-ACP methyl ester carboxylesterase
MEKDISTMRYWITGLSALLLFPLLIALTLEQPTHRAPAPHPLLPMWARAIDFPLDDQSTVEYWHWKRKDALPANPITWVMPGIGGPGEILDNEFARDMIEIMQSRYVDQIIVVQLRGHSLDSELACYTDHDFETCVTAHQANGVDLSKYHYLQYAKDVIQLREHLGIPEWHIWGASYGGRVAGAMAMLDPEGTSGLLLDSSVAFQPADRPKEQATSAELLHKLYAACEVFDDCFERIDGTLTELAEFIAQFENPKHRIMGMDNISINKADWIYVLNNLMYYDHYDFALDFIFTHIRNPQGYVWEDLSEQLQDEFSAIYSETEPFYADKWSINYWITNCNEDASENTYRTTEFGVYGSHLDMSDYCWPGKTDLVQTAPFKAPDIPVMIVHLPFDNVITYQDGESFLQYWPYAQWCTIEVMGHTMSSEHASEMIINLSRNQSHAPTFCQLREPKLYTPTVNPS